jgi:hypothetical protein
VKRNAFAIGTVVLLFVLSFTGCVGVNKDMVIEEAVNCFCEFCDEAAGEIDEDISALNEQLAWVGQKEDALADITHDLDAIVTTVDWQVSNEKLETGAWWEYIMTPDQCDLYSNAHYSLEEFDLHWAADMSEGIWVLNSSIVIKDRETGAKGTPELLHEMLTSRKTRLTDQTAAATDNKENIDRTLIDVVEQKDNWQVREVESQVYSISGYGLGYTEQLIDGEWYYYQAGGVIEPMSSASSRLMDLMTTGQSG